ncbi:hypothetical protein HBI42_218570 [Parastagonospora nodorum]|nr:hypothetical protein HBI43_216120 [Parastagonospora nodorum]KAH6243384.1 hypothetical protein HBI42_218570 [Parastagonospora nodorum]
MVQFTFNIAKCPLIDVMLAPSKFGYIATILLLVALAYIRLRVGSFSAVAQSFKSMMENLSIVFILLLAVVSYSPMMLTPMGAEIGAVHAFASLTGLLVITLLVTWPLVVLAIVLKTVWLVFRLCSRLCEALRYLHQLYQEISLRLFNWLQGNTRGTAVSYIKDQWTGNLFAGFGVVPIAATYLALYIVTVISIRVFERAPTYTPMGPPTTSTDFTCGYYGSGLGSSGWCSKH